MKSCNCRTRQNSPRARARRAAHNAARRAAILATGDNAHTAAFRAAYRVAIAREIAALGGLVAIEKLRDAMEGKR